MAEVFTPVFYETRIIQAAIQSADIDLDTTSETFGHLIVIYQNGDTVDYGIVTAYAAAVNTGYTGTEEQWTEEISTVRAFATGKKYSDGDLVPLEEGDTGYHDNARYWADETSGYAKGTNSEGASLHADESAKHYSEVALEHKNTAERFAKGTVNNNAVTEGDGFEDNSKYYKERSNDFSLISEGYAEGTQKGTNVTSSSPYYQHNAKYWEAESSKNAAQAEVYTKGGSVTYHDASGATQTIAAGSVTTTDSKGASYTLSDDAKDWSEKSKHEAEISMEMSSDANTSALKSEGYAEGTQNGAASSSYAQINAKYWAQEAKGYATGKDLNNNDLHESENAKLYKDQAVAAYNSLVNMSVGITTGEPDTNATVEKSVDAETGYDHLQFTIPRGAPFVIYKTYQTINEMKEDYLNVPEGKFVMIATTVEEPDNSKMYVRTSSNVKDEAFSFITDLSGATGVQGPIASATPSVKYQEGTSGTVVPTGEWSDAPSSTAGKYLWTRVQLTWNDTAGTVTTFYSVVYNGINGSITSVDGIEADDSGEVTLPEYSDADIDSLFE